VISSHHWSRSGTDMWLSVRQVVDVDSSYELLLVTVFTPPCIDRCWKDDFRSDQVQGHGRVQGGHQQSCSSWIPEQSERVYYCKFQHFALHFDSIMSIRWYIVGLHRVGANMHTCRCLICIIIHDYNRWNWSFLCSKQSNKHTTIWKELFWLPRADHRLAHNNNNKNNINNYLFLGTCHAQT